MRVAAKWSAPFAIRSIDRIFFFLRAAAALSAMLDETWSAVIRPCNIDPLRRGPASKIDAPSIDLLRRLLWNEAVGWGCPRSTGDVAPFFSDKIALALIGSAEALSRSLHGAVDGEFEEIAAQSTTL
jgi:hypothetical protein